MLKIFANPLCVNYQKGYCLFLIDGTRAGRKCCSKQCRLVKQILAEKDREEKELKSAKGEQH